MHDAAGVHPLGRAGKAALALLLAVAVAGCASSQERAGEPPGGETGEVRTGAGDVRTGEGEIRAGTGNLPPGVQQSKLHVTNRNWLDMRIYAVRGSERITLLSITSMRTDSIPLPRRLLTGGGFRLLADPVGADPYRSNVIYLHPGQTVWWRLENTLDQSSLWVY